MRHVVIVLVITIAVVVGGSCAFFWTDKYTCMTIGVEMQRETKFVGAVGCMIKTKSRHWVPLEQFRVLE